MSLSNEINSIKLMIELASTEIASLESGVKASAPRARKALQSIKTASHELRKNITASIKKTKPIKEEKKEEEKKEEIKEGPVKEEKPIKKKRVKKTL